MPQITRLTDVRHATANKEASTPLGLLASQGTGHKGLALHGVDRWGREVELYGAHPGETDRFLKPLEPTVYIRIAGQEPRPATLEELAEAAAAAQLRVDELKGLGTLDGPSGFVAVPGLLDLRREQAEKGVWKPTPAGGVSYPPKPDFGELQPWRVQVGTSAGLNTASAALNARELRFAFTPNDSTAERKLLGGLVGLALGEVPPANVRVQSEASVNAFLKDARGTPEMESAILAAYTSVTQHAYRVSWKGVEAFLLVDDRAGEVKAFAVHPAERALPTSRNDAAVRLGSETVEPGSFAQNLPPQRDVY